MARRKLILAFFLLLVANLAAQDYEVSTCEEMGLHPIIPASEDGPRVDLLENYYVPNAAGVGGLGCWTYHHPNGRDFVVTPHGWGNPANTPKRKQLIDEAMEAITDARALYITYGNMDHDLYYVLNDVDYGVPGHTMWVTNGECWMISGVPGLAADDTPGERKFVFAHEVGHCFVMENVLNLGKKYDELNAWFDESVSEFLASDVYETVDREIESAREFNVERPFRKKYAAYSLFEYFVKERGKADLVPFLNKLTTTFDIKERLRFMRELDFDQLAHNYLYEYRRDRLKDRGTSRILPKVPLTEAREIVLDPGLNEEPLPELWMLRLERINIQIPEGFNAKIRPVTGSDKTFFQSIMVRDGASYHNWDSEIYVEGDCFTEQSLELMISHINEDPLEDLKLSYELEARTDCCSGLEGSMEGCMVGTWEVDISTISHLLDYDVSGTLKVTFENVPAGRLDASFDLRFDFDNGDYDTHKGSVSACVLPLGRAGLLNYFQLSGVALGAGNVHTHFYSRKGKFLDLTDDVIEGLNRYKFNYTSCTPDILTVLYFVQMARVRE
nr:hypothetical protein [Allomuricauda sp.]